LNAGRDIAFVVVAATLFLATGGGCRHGAAAPADVVRGFAQCAARGDWDAAYVLMSDDYRRRVPLGQFRSEMDADRPIVQADAIALAAQKTANGSSTRALVSFSDGQHFPVVLPVVLNDGHWKLEEQPLAPFGQQSPRSALKTLLRAIDLKRYDVLLRLVPARQRTRVTEETMRLYWDGPEATSHRRPLDLLRAYMNAQIVELGTEAQMPYGEPNVGEGEVRFVLEGGVWKVDDLR
jgi:hypothetical protein